jgi:hypothetical protein
MYVSEILIFSYCELLELINESNCGIDIIIELISFEFVLTITGTIFIPIKNIHINMYIYYSKSIKLTVYFNANIKK